MTQAIHRQLEAPASEAATMVTNRVTNWQVLEESEEEVIVDIEGRRLELSPVIPALPAGSAQKSPLCHDSRRLGPNPHWLGKENTKGRPMLRFITAAIPDTSNGQMLDTTA